MSGATVTVAGREYGSAELTEAIRHAIKAQNFEAVDGLLRLLADLSAQGDFLTLEETKRFLSEVLSASSEGLPESALMDAARAVDELVIGGAMVELWRARPDIFSFTWHDGQLHLRKAPDTLASVPATAAWTVAPTHGSRG